VDAIMKKAHDIWIEHHKKAEFVEPVAIVGSPGLRSIGKLVIRSLIAETRAQLIAELYSTHLPSIYQTAPSYAANPFYPGFGGALVNSARADLPSIQFYACSMPELILVAGYHPNFEGHYDVAETVVTLLSENHVKRMIVVAGYGSTVKNIVCAANIPSIISEMKEKFNIGVGYKGPFMGFSGLVFGLAARKNIEALCLFAATTPTEHDLEFPDQEASERVLEKLRKMFKLS
jgi:proteasome assembly chaperone (PAC2) family protein